MRILNIIYPAVALIGCTYTTATEIDSDGKSHHLDLSSLFDNRGFGTGPNDGDFDGIGGTYPAAHLPPSNLTYSGVSYTFPSYRPNGPDNLISGGQTLTPPHGPYFSFHLLAASTGGTTTGSIAVTYADNTTALLPVRVPPWWTHPYPKRGDFIMPFRNTAAGADWNKTMIFETASWIDVTREVVRITLPTPTRNTLHIFAATLLGPTGPGLEIQHARSTRKWVEGSEKWQVVEVLVNNVDAARWVHGKGVEVTVTGPGVRTVQPGRIWRLRPGDQARVQVAVVNRAGVPAGATGPATVVLKGPGVERRHVFSAVYGIPQYAPTLDSVLQHETPAWYDDAKFGVFIHWGVYSVPGWGNVGDKEVYAEWYWWNMNKGPGTKDDTWQYHLDTYGADVVYDDFIQNFTADKYDPKEWVDLFNEAGAKYFVSVISKHHDGYALFDLPASVSKRTSVALPPHRNLLKELFDASTTHHPHLRRATYYSLPEWFNPSYTPYGFRLWPGGLAHSPYTNATLPYTGHVAPGANASYLTTLLLPSLTALAALGTDLLWCDIGGPNLTVPFAASWFNAAAAAGRQVALNDRCGIPGDFSTPEYARYDTTTRAKWEANRGLDPYSYGFNRATPRGAYMNASTIILTLLDVISKGGNLLLDIGPRADGTIVEAQSEALRGAGKWIGDGHAEGVYGTAYWFVQPQEGAARFVHTQRAFYVWLLERPEAVVRIWAPVPWRPGDGVVVVGGGMAGTVLDAERVDGVLEIRVPEEVAAAETVAWGVKIVYGTE